MTNRQEADFWVTFGSNAREFSAALPGNLEGARKEIANLKKEIASLFDEAAQTSPSLGQGLIKELQAANREINGLSTGIKRMAGELDTVVNKLRNLKIEPGVAGGGGRSAAGGVSAATVEAAATKAAQTAINEYVRAQETQAKSAGETAQAAKRGAASSTKAARDVSASVAAGEAADRERVAAEKEIAKQKKAAAKEAKEAAKEAARVAREQAQAAAAAPPAAPAPAPRPTPAPTPPPAATPARAAAPAGTRLGDAQRFVAGLSGQQILDKLKAENGDVSSLAQALNMSGRGDYSGNSAKNKANEIAKRYQNFAIEAAQAVEKTVEQAVTSAPKTSNAVRVDVEAALQGLNEKALHAAVQQMNELFGTSVDIRTAKTDKRRNMGTIVRDAVRALENVADEQVNALVQGLEQARQQVASAGAATGKTYRGGPGGTYRARSAAEWQAYSKETGFVDTVEKMGGEPALRSAGYLGQMEPKFEASRADLGKALERLQGTHPEVAADTAKADTSRKRTKKAAQRLAQAEESSAKSTEVLAAAAEQQAAVLEAEVAETRAAGTMSLADVRAQIQERVQRQRETELLDRNQKARKQIDKIKDPIERESAIRQWESRQRQTASFESQALAATVIPHEGLSAKGSLDFVRTRLLNDETAGLPEDDAIAMARRIDYATSQQRMQGLMATGRSRKRTPIGTMIDTEYAGYVQSAQEAAAAHTPLGEFQKIRQEGGLGRSEEGIAAYRELIQRAGEASIPLRDIESALRANARAGGQYRTAERGADSIHRANMEEVLTRGGEYGGDTKRSQYLQGASVALDERASDSYARLGQLRQQRSNVQAQLRVTGRAIKENPEDVALRESAARLNQYRDEIRAQIDAEYRTLNTLWDSVTPFSPTAGRGGAPHTQAEWDALRGSADRTKTAGAHTLPGPTGSIIPTPSSTKRGGDPTVGGVDEEMRQRLLGGYYTGYTEEQMRAKPFAELRAEAAGVGIHGRSRDALISQILERYPAGATNQEFGARQAGVFQEAGPARANYEQTIRQGALEFLQQNPNWDPFAKVGTPQGKRNNKGPSTRRAINEIDKAIEYWDQLALDFNHYIASISQQIAEAGGAAQAPTKLLEKLDQANRTAVETLGPNARAVMEGASAREQYRAARTAADARPGSRVQRKTSADEMFFSAYEQLFGRRLGLIAPHLDPNKTQFGASGWRLSGGQVSGGFENYVSPLMRGDLDRTQMRKLRQATDVAAGTGDALHNFITTSLPEDFSGDVESLPQALKVELQRLRKAAQQSRQRLDKLITQYAALNEGDYVADVGDTRETEAERKERVSTAEAATKARQKATGVLPVAQRRELEAQRERAANLQATIARYEAGDVPNDRAREHIGELLGIAPTGFTAAMRPQAETEIKAKVHQIQEMADYGRYPKGDAAQRIAELQAPLNAPAYEPDAFSPEQLAEARRLADKQYETAAKRLQKSYYAEYVEAGNIPEETPYAEPRPVAQPSRASRVKAEADAGIARAIDMVESGSAVTTETVRAATGSAPLNDVAARAADRMTAAIEKLEAAIQKLYDRFRPGQKLVEGMQPATGGASGGGGGTRRPRAAAAAAEPPDDKAAAQLAAQQSESKSERLTREQREQNAYEEARRTATARRREILAGLPAPDPNDRNDKRANVRGLVSQAILPGVSPDERLDLLTQAGTAMRRQYNYRYKSEIPQLAEVGGLSREEKGVLDVRVSAAAKAYTTAAEAAKRLQDIQKEQSTAAERVAATQGLVDKAMQVSSRSTQEAIQEVQRLIAVERTRALTEAESAQLYEARVRAYAMMDAELSRIDPDTRRPLLNQALRRPLERAALGVSGPQLIDIHQEAGARDAIRRVADAGVDEATAQGGKLRRAMSAMFGVNNSFGGRAIAGAGTAVVRTFSYGAVFGVVNEMQKIFRTSIETEAEFVRISDALNATGRSAGNLRSSLQSISSDLATPLEEVYVTASQLTGVFQNTRGVEFATRAVEQLKLISRGALNSQEAISSLQAVTSAYGLHGAEDFQKVVDKATAIQNFTGANVEQLLEGAGGIAPQARAFHLTQDQALLYPGLIAQRTNQSGTAAAEQLSRIFESLAAPAASQFLTRRGFATEAQVRGSDFGHIIENLVHQRATGHLGDNDLVALERLVGARQARPLAALIGTAQQAQATERGAVAADDSAGAGQRRVHQLMQQLNRELQQLSVNLTNIGAALVRSGFLGGLQHAVSLLNIILATAGKIGEVFATLGKIPGGSFIGKLLIEAGTLYVAAKLIGATFRSISEYTNRVLKQNDEAVASRGIRGVAPVDANGYPAALGYGTSRDTSRAGRAAVINEQNALRAGVQQQLANQPRYSFFRNPTAGLVAGAGTLGARALDTPFIRMGSALENAGTAGTRFSNITTRMGSGMTSLGRSMTTVSTSSQVLRGRMEALSSSGTAMGKFTGLLTGLGNAALFAAPFIIAGVQGVQQMHQQYQDFLKATFPDAVPGSSAVGADRNRVAQTADEQAVSDARGASRGVGARIGAFGGFVLHGIGGLFSSHQRDEQVGSMGNLAGSFSNRATTIGDTSRAAEPLNDAIGRTGGAADTAMGAIKGLEDGTKTIGDINADFTAAAKKIANDPKLSEAQKTAATAWLDQWHRKVTDIYSSMQQKNAGIASANVMTTDQAGAFGDVIQGGMGLTNAQRRNGIGTSLYQTFVDQGLVAQGSDSSYYLAKLYGGSAAVPNDPTLQRLPGAPHNVGPELYSVGTSASQRQEANLMRGIDPNSFAGQQKLQGKLADTLEKQAIPAMAKALSAEQDNPQQYAADLAKFKSLVDFDGQIRLSMAQEAVQSASELAQILQGQGDNGGAVRALDQAIAADRKNLANAKTASEKYAIQLDIAQKQRQQADIQAGPGINAANQAAANATNPGAQASAALDAANKKLSELQGLRAKGKGGVTDDDISNAKVAVANANQAIVQNSESITESAAALLQAQTLDPFRKVQESISELKRQIAYYRARGDTAKVNELASQLTQAQQSAADLAAESAQAHTGLLIAIATAAGRTVQAAQLGLRQAQQAYAKALKDNGGNKKAPAVENARAAVVSAQANIRDTWLQDREDDLKFQFDMNKISYSSYVAQLQELLKRKDLTKKQRQDIERTIKDLQTQSQGMWNLGSIRQPTPYEMRALMANGLKVSDHSSARVADHVTSANAATAAAATTPTVNHYDNRTFDFKGLDKAEIIALLRSILGADATSRTATATRKA